MPGFSGIITSVFRDSRGTCSARPMRKQTIALQLKSQATRDS